MRSKLPIFSLFQIIFEGRTSLRILAGAIGSFSFSIAVILATIGLMDGFEITLKKALSNANGDIKISNYRGFYLENKKLNKSLKKVSPKASSSILQIEAFAVANEKTKGVVLKGIKHKSFTSVSGVNLSKLEIGVVIGSELSKLLKLKVGDSLVLALPSESARVQGGAILKSFVVEDIITHGIFEKDLRFIYISRSTLAEILSYRQTTINTTLVKLKNFSNLKHSINKLRVSLGPDYRVEPFWSEFSVLIDAVEVEKYSISIILQLIVIVAILNIAAFIIYVSEKKSRDFFMLRAMGLSLGAIQRFWFLALTGIWALSCFVGYVLVQLVNLVVLYLPFFKIPGDIYVLSRLEIILSSKDYLVVFLVSFIWITLMGFMTMFRLRSKSVISGLRQEFA